MRARIKQATNDTKNTLRAVFQPHRVLKTVALALQLLKAVADNVSIPGLTVAVGVLQSVIDKLDVSYPRCTYLSLTLTVIFLRKQYRTKRLLPN
jgi:hypothetical protein